jgi:hypothetical protein
MQRTHHGAQKTSGDDSRVLAQPTRHSIAAALAAQRREREAFARLTGSKVSRDGRMHLVARHD